MPEDKSKRTHERIPHLMPASVRWSNGGVHEEVWYSRDVSQNSVFLYTDVELKMGSYIEVAMPLPPEITGKDKQIVVRCKARIVRIQQRESDKRVGIAAVYDDFEVVQSDMYPTEAPPAAE